MTEPATIEVTLNGQTTEIPYEKGDSLLDAALKASLNAPYSCMDGMCTACLAQVQKGEVDFPTDTALDDADFKTGKILTCQARLKDTCLKLKITYDL